MHRTILIAVMSVFIAGLASAQVEPRGSFAIDSIPGAIWRFDGPVGDRIDAHIENWVLRAPDANPGLLEMFNRRDRH